MPRSSPVVLRAPLLAFLLALAAGAATAADGWVSAAKARSPEDISLWTRMIPGAELKAFRGATHTRVPMANIVAMLNSTEAMKRYVFRCQHAELLGEAANGDQYLYLQINGIWPLEDRDAVIRLQPRFDARTGEFLVTGTAAPDYLPRRAGFVRIPSIESTWRMTPAADGLLRLEFTGHVDPAGSVPRWLANTIVTLVPRYTLKEVRDELRREEWTADAARLRGQQLIDRYRAGAR